MRVKYVLSIHELGNHKSNRKLSHPASFDDIIYDFTVVFIDSDVNKCFTVSISDEVRHIKSRIFPAEFNPGGRSLRRP